MKIKSETDLHISTTWGASIFLKAGETREVGDDLGYQALQQGAVEAKAEAPKPKPAAKKRGRPKKTTTKTVRARDEKGHYKGDDPSTPDVNEAFIEVEVAESPKE